MLRHQLCNNNFNIRLYLAMVSLYMDAFDWSICVRFRFRLQLLHENRLHPPGPPKESRLKEYKDKMRDRAVTPTVQREVSACLRISCTFVMLITVSCLFCESSVSFNVELRSFSLFACLIAHCRHYLNAFSGLY